MSRETKQDHDQSVIDAMLKTFTSRSNVKSAIILSRKDGSIIHATGLPASRRRTISTSRAYNVTQSNDVSAPGYSNAIEGSKGDDGAESQKEETSTVQQLAATIYEFVGASSKLAASVQETSTLSDGAGGDVANRAGAGVQENNTGTENDVHLLRMRTRKQEIIIYPDSNYLCCVIQDLPGSASGGGPL